MTNTNHPELEDEEEVTDDDSGQYCSIHMQVMNKGYSAKRDAFNNPKPYWFHRDGIKMCFGKGFR